MASPPLISALLALFLSTLALRGQPPRLSSDEPIEFDAATQSLRARGHATFIHGEMNLLADEIQFFRKENKAAARGSVRVNYKNFRLLGEALTYDLKSRTFTSGAFRIGSPPVFVEGSGFSGTVEKIEADDAVLYFREPNPLLPNIKAQRATVYPNDRIEAEKVLFRVGEFPLFYLPKYSQAMEASAIRLDGKIGFRDNLGAYYQTNTLFPLFENVEVGTAFDAYSKRGVLLGPSLAWRFNQPASRGHGFLKSGYINDSGDRDFDLLGRPIDEDRYFIEFRHRQRFGDRLSLTARVSDWSDSEILRDFRPRLFRNDQQPDSFVEANYRGKNFFLSAFARFDVNKFHPTRERLPEIRFDLVPVPVFKTGLYQSLHLGYVRLEENELDLGRNLESDRFDFHYTLYRPWKINKWLNLTALAGTRLTHYADTLNSREGFTRTLGEFGFDAEAKAFATWNYKNEKWGIDGLRHILKPIIRYRYLPGGGNGREDIIPIDREVFSTNVPPIDLQNIRAIDDLSDLSVLRLGLENLLQTRDREYGSRNLAELNFYQDIRFSAAPGERELSNLYTQLKISPLQWFEFGLYNRFDPVSLTNEETRTRLSLVNGDLWKLAFSTNNLRNQIDQYEIDFRYKLNERWAFRTRLRLDTRRDEFTEQIYSLQQRLGGAWEVEYQLAVHNGSSREDDFNFNIRINLLRF